MSLRLTRLDQLQHVSPHVRAQLEREMLDAGIDHPDAEPRGDAVAQSGRRARPEQRAGKALVQWADRAVLPDYVFRYLQARARPGEDIPNTIGAYLHHTPNGGARTAVEAGILKGQGVRPGWPDYSLYLPLGGWAGLVLELKAPDGGKPDADQLVILRRLEIAGYKVEICWGYDHARAAIETFVYTRP